MSIAKYKMKIVNVTNGSSVDKISAETKEKVLFELEVMKTAEIKYELGQTIDIELFKRVEDGESYSGPQPYSKVLDKGEACSYVYNFNVEVYGVKGKSVFFSGGGLLGFLSNDTTLNESLKIRDNISIKIRV